MNGQDSKEAPHCKVFDQQTGQAFEKEGEEKEQRGAKHRDAKHCDAKRRNTLCRGTKLPFSSLRRQQQLRIVMGASILALAAFGIYCSLAGSEGNSPLEPEKNQKITQQEVSELGTPLSPVDDREIWVSRVEKKTENVRQETDRVKAENQFLHKRVDVLEDLLTGKRPHPSFPKASTETDSLAPNSGTEVFPVTSSSSDTSAEMSDPGQRDRIPVLQPFPDKNKGMDNEPDSRSPLENHLNSNHLDGIHAGTKKQGAKILHLTGLKGFSHSGKSPDVYLPAGTYCQAVVDMGVAVSTATNSQGNPEPIRLRLVDNGNLPGGFKGLVKDAILIGACYGDISSERARCRLETFSWRDQHGVQIEKKIEGWIVGEDGIAGLRGKVVDRSGAIAREAFGAGLLSAAANFLKFEATSSVYPMTPFGQSHSLSKGHALQGAVGAGAGNALDKLAEFSIKRAEQMQPVILVASGRVVDVLLKSGLDLTLDARDDMQMAGSASSETNSEIQEN